RPASSMAVSRARLANAPPLSTRTRTWWAIRRASSTAGLLARGRNGTACESDPPRVASPSPSRLPSPAMRHALVPLSLFVLALTGCSGDDQPNDLTARLGEGQARAGVITKEAELIG